MVEEHMNPKILSLGFAVPQYSATQSEVMGYFGFKSPMTRRIFEATGIERRYGYVDPTIYKRDPSWQELTEWYKKGAVELGALAARDALDGYSMEDISLITFSSVSGYVCPAPSYAIAAELGLRSNVVHTNILGQGCQSACPSLERAYDHVKSKGGLALSVTAEICSATWFPTRNERDLEYIVSASIFADGASAAVVGYDDNPRHPEIIDFESFYDPEYLDLLGYAWVDGRLKVVLSMDVPKVVPPLIRQTVDVILKRNSLSKRDISHWMIHPGGRTVLENVEKELELSREQTHWSWEVMRRFGNMSSSTLGCIAKHVQQHDNPSGWGVAATMGAGTAVNACLVKWE